nr:hypothetical protein [Cytophagales bacterium]
MRSFCLFILPLQFFILSHPFYISLTDMVYKGDEQRLEIAQKIFWDDLEVGLEKHHQTPIDFINDSDRAKLDKLLADYLMAHNTVMINDSKISLTYLGHEIEDDAAWFYFEATNVPQPTKVTIKNTLLFGEFPSQQNVVNFYVNKRPRSVITTTQKPEGVLQFEE